MWTAATHKRAYGPIVSFALVSDLTAIWHWLWIYQINWENFRSGERQHHERRHLYCRCHDDVRFGKGADLYFLNADVTFIHWTWLLQYEFINFSF